MDIVELKRQAAERAVDFVESDMVVGLRHGSTAIFAVRRIAQLLREKIVAQASRREIIVVDESKLSPALGTHWPVPVEVIPFGCRSQHIYIESLGAKVKVRQSEDGNPFRTDQGNQLLDCNFGPISNPYEIAAKLDQRAGIVEHGLFLDLATDVISAGEQGIHHLKRG